MRAASTAVVLSSLLIGSAAIAQPKTGSPTPPKTGTTGTTGTTTTGAKPGTPAPTGTTPTGGTAPTGTTPTGTTPVASTTPSADPDPSTVKPEDMPTAVRMRRLEQQTQALKERAWQLKARVQMLKEQMLGGGVGAQALVSHSNEMGSSFRLVKLTYSLDGSQVLSRSEEAEEALYKTKSFDVFAGPIAPGNHTLTAVATYRGHGYGVFAYLSKYTFTARGAQSFTTAEGKISKVDCRAFEKGGPTTPLEKRPALECKVTQVSPEKAPDAPVPAPAAPAGPTTPTTQPGK